MRPTRTKLRPHGGRLIDAQLSNWPVTPRADLNLVLVRFFVVVVGRIVVFIVVCLFWFSLVCLSFHRGTVPNRIRGYAENLELLESGLWFTSDTRRQEHADVTDEITAKGEAS